jgi:hypothetical protein
MRKRIAEIKRQEPGVDHQVAFAFAAKEWTASKMGRKASRPSLSGLRARAQATRAASKAAGKTGSHRVKRLPSGYNLYMKDALKGDAYASMDHNLRFKKIAAAWKAMPADEKKVWLNRVAKRLSKRASQL